MNQELPSTAPNSQATTVLVVRASGVEDEDATAKSPVYRLLKEPLTECLQAEGGLAFGPAAATAKRLVDAIAPIWGGQHVYFPKIDNRGLWLVGIDAMDPDWSVLHSDPADDSLDAVLRRCVDGAEDPLRSKLDARQILWRNALDAISGGDSLTPEALALRLQLSRARVFAALWDFEDFEWVTRERRSEPQEGSVLVMTDKGRAALAELHGNVQRQTAPKPAKAGEGTPSANAINRIAFYGDMGRRAMRVLIDECLLDAERARITARAMNIAIGSALEGEHLYFPREDKRASSVSATCVSTRS